MPTMPMAGLRAAMTADLARLKGDARIIMFGCDNAADIGKLRGEGVAVMSLPCTAMLPPSFIEYALHERQADGVFITGCRENDCYHRMGGEWTTQRLAREREPRLRGRVERDRERIRLFWASSADFKELSQELEAFRASLHGQIFARTEVNDKHP
jgi:coenzyme F420-reducing hydrogenase delta subunit